MDQGRVIQAVGFAHRPGRNTIRRDIERLCARAFVAVLFRGRIPAELRERLTPKALAFARRISRNPIWSPIGGAAGAKSDAFENDLLKLIFNATAIANIADNAAASPLTNLYVSLHTADPGEAGDQSTSEATYTSYARVAVARTSGGFTVTANSVSPVAAITFPTGTGGGGTATHFGVGVAASGATKLLYSGPISPTIPMGNGITPELSISTVITED